MAPKVIRDPVHNHIYFDRKTDKLILDLLECREVQRLRRIRQLGVAHFTYPGAEHSRFSHSLGVCHLMKRALHHVSVNDGDERPPSEVHRSAVMAAALLHDIGHGPFSHVLERDFSGDHERRTIELIKDESTEVHRALSRHNRDVPGLVADILMGQKPEVLWLRALITSQLDVDRMDYLLRDSHFCGVGYGRYDHEYIFHTMRIHKVPPDDLLQPVWLHKACRVIEEYLFARYYMHWNVYYHHTTKGYEELLKAICECAAELIKDGSVSAPPAIRKLVCREALTCSEFLALDDGVLMACIGA